MCDELRGNHHFEVRVEAEGWVRLEGKREVHRAVIMSGCHLMSQ